MEKMNKLLKELNSINKYIKEQKNKKAEYNHWVKKTHNKWIKVGEFNVEGGTVIIGELFTPEDIEKTFQKDIDMDDDSKPWMIQLPHGGGVICSTGYGDGKYEVKAKLCNGRIKEIKIEFF